MSAAPAGVGVDFLESDFSPSFPKESAAESWKIYSTPFVKPVTL